jgi:RNA polymerase sigma factor (sigma-70 family)
VTDNLLNTELWRRIRNGEQEAIESLYRLLYFDLFNYGIHLCGDVELTKDAINDIFLEIWEKRDKLVDVNNIKSWLFTYIRRKLYFVIRQSKKKNVASLSYSATMADHEGSFEEYLVEKQSIQDVKQKVAIAIGKLTERQKELVQLRYFESLTVEDIARKTGLSSKTVYNTIYNVLRILSTELVILLIFFC